MDIARYFESSTAALDTESRSGWRYRCAVVSDVSGDFAEVVDGYPYIGHPGQSSVPEVVAPQVLVAELGYDFIPRCRVPQHGSGDPATAWTGEQSCVGVAVRRGNPLQCEFMNFRNEGYGAGTLPFGALVD